MRESAGRFSKEEDDRIRKALEVAMVLDNFFRTFVLVKYLLY